MSRLTEVSAVDTRLSRLHGGQRRHYNNRLYEAEVHRFPLDICFSSRVETCVLSLHSTFKKPRRYEPQVRHRGLQ